MTGTISYLTTAYNSLDLDLADSTSDVQDYLSSVHKYSSRHNLGKGQTSASSDEEATGRIEVL
jgi:hypothetical protein